MKTVDDNQSVLVIAGMHRSGTSFTASLLQNAGINIGERLMVPNYGNVKGYFENLDFVDFHRKVLVSQGINEAGWLAQGEVTVEDYFREDAKEVVSKNAIAPLWGWKDPRTTLFLDFWADLLPETNFLFVYRTPWEVADSLYRRAVRSQEMFLEYPDFAIKVWLHYNRKVLDFVERFPDRSILVSVYDVAHKPQALINELNQKFGTRLVLPQENVYDQTLLSMEASKTYRPALVGHYFPETLDIYRELGAKASNFGETPSLEWLESIKSSPYRIWAFQDWVKVRSLEIQNQDQKNELDHLRAQLQHIQTELLSSQTQCQAFQPELLNSQTQLQSVQVELVSLQTQLQQTQAEFANSQTQLQQTQAELVDLQTQLQHTHVELGQSQTQFLQAQEEVEGLRVCLAQAHQAIEAMKTSKFWKLRHAWLRFRKLLNDKGVD